ncbi:MAG: ClpXP protease specificity-enhancing factor [Azoarcus sp.]|jgi:stringent starvation protein B|nr:ClpXP protease specificity-enhancing factor [Azoarcus sp.]
MMSTKPYLIRAIYEWCVDQGYTPYLAAQVDEHTRVPAGHVRDGQIVLNVSPEATNQLIIDNEQVGFQTRFNGVVHQITVPVANIAAIYARENGQGMAFEVQPAERTADKPPPEDDPPPRGGFLKVIK